MDDLYDKIENLCKENRITITTMCKMAGISRAPLSDLKMRRSKTLSAVTISKIAAYFDVPVDCLLGTYTKKRGKTVRTDNPEDRYPYLLGKSLEGTLSDEEEKELAMWHRWNQAGGYFEQLNEIGQKEAVKRVRELAEIPAYREQSFTEATPLTQQPKDTPEE